MDNLSLVRKLEMEQKPAEYTGSKHYCCFGGTDSLAHRSYGTGLGVGDEVITVPYTRWISTAEVVALLGAKPVFVDIRSRYLGIWTVTQVEARHYRC